MIGQMQITSTGAIRDKVEMAIQRLKAFEPPEGYYVAFSGGKDSQCVYHLCKMAGVKFDAHYAVTSVDPPELVRFIKEHYPDVAFNRRHDKDGKPVTMWSLIPEMKMPPTRIVRYCCEELKESNGAGRWTITGVRGSESTNRKANQGIITVTKAGVKFKRELKNMGSNFTETVRGGVVLNYDDAEGRRVVESCIRTGKALLNPIYEWDEEDVWEFLNGNGIPHCCLYDEGWTRLGCIGCPMKRRRKMEKDFERWPKYKALYLRTFSRMLEARKKAGLPCESWNTPEDVMEWWMGE